MTVNAGIGRCGETFTGQEKQKKDDQEHEDL